MIWRLLMPASSVFLVYRLHLSIHLVELIEESAVARFEVAFEVYGKHIWKVHDGLGQRC